MNGLSNKLLAVKFRFLKVLLKKFEVSGKTYLFDVTFFIIKSLYLRLTDNFIKSYLYLRQGKFYEKIRYKICIRICLRHLFDSSLFF